MEKAVYLDLLEFLKNLREQRHLQLPPPPTPAAQVSLNDAPVQELVVLSPGNKRTQITAAKDWRAFRKTNLIAQSDRDLASGSFFESERR